MSEEVLLLDDDPTMLGILQGILKAGGYLCVAAQNADAALGLIAERPEIAVVVSDIMMPGVNGFEFVDRLNALDMKHAPPRVLFLTGQPTLEGAVGALRLGVRDFLGKPVRPAELIASVGRVLSQARESRGSQTQRSPQVAQVMRQAEELMGKLRTMARSIEPEDSDGRNPVQVTSATVRNGFSLSPEAVETRAPGDQAMLSVLDAIEQLRRLRTRYAHHRLDDVAWDLLLELLRAERYRQRLSVSGLAISINGVSTATSLRRINELTAREYMERLADPDDARRDFVVLTPKSHALLSEFLAQANVHVSALTT